MANGKRSGPRRSGLERLQATFARRSTSLFPIETASELKAALSGGSPYVTILQTRLDLRKLIDEVPPFYFPVTSLANLAAKARYLYRQNEHRIGVPQRVAPVLKRVAEELSYPVTHVEQLRTTLRRLNITAIPHGARTHSVDSALERVPSSLFPIRSKAHLYSLTRRLGRTRNAR